MNTLASLPSLTTTSCVTSAGSALAFVAQTGSELTSVVVAAGAAPSNDIFPVIVAADAASTAAGCAVLPPPDSPSSPNSSSLFLPQLVNAIESDTIPISTYE